MTFKPSAKAVPWILVLVLSVGLFAAGYPLPGPEAAPSHVEPEPQKAHDAEPAVVASAVPLVAKELSASDIYVAASPAIVRVEVRDRAFKLIGHGTGFLVAEDGLVATNHHVIQNAYSAHVSFADGSKYPVEGVAASLAASDLALLKIPGQHFPTLTLAKDALPSVGAKVYAIGNPQGLTNSLSDGLVSGHRQFDHDFTLIQTTAAISPGSSGGPLLSKDGKVVGVTTASIRGGQNLNLAVPAKVLREVINGRGQLQTLASAGGQPLKADEAQQLDDVWSSLERQDYGKALKLLARLREFQKGSAAYWFAVGYVQGKLDNHDLAIDAWRNAVSLDPSDAATFYNLGHTYQSLRRHREAIAAYKSALLLKPNDTQALNNTGIAYTDLGDHQQALAFFKSVVAIEPDNAIAWSQMGCSCALSNQSVESVRCFKTAVTLNPNDAPSFYFMATELKRLRRYEEAIQACESAIRLNPNDAMAYTTMGDCYMFLNEYQTAMQPLKTAISINPNIASAHLYLGMCYSMARQIPAAQVHWQRAWMLDPSGQTGRNAKKLLDIGRR